MITTESHLGVLVRNSTLMKGAAWHFSRTILNMLAILSPIKLKELMNYSHKHLLNSGLSFTSQVSLMVVVSNKIKPRSMLHWT